MPRDDSIMEDLAWLVRHGTQDILPHWLRVANRSRGPLATRHDRQWRPLPMQVATIVSQGRLIHNFAAGLRLTGDRAYADACIQGADFLLEGLRDEEHGGWFYSCDLRGAILDDRKDSYGHAFVTFGLSHAYAAIEEERYAAGAMDAWRTVRDRLADSRGGVVGHRARDFAGAAEDHRSQNPLMHLFEALLALWEATGSAEARDDALRVGSFVIERLVLGQGNPLPEVYSEEWEPLSESEGGRIDIGHQFEWAYLLSKGAAMGLPRAWLAYAEGMLGYALTYGIDARDGGVISPVGLSGAPLAGSRKGWWEQCEAMRALARWAITEERDGLAEPFRRILAYARSDFVDPLYGGWYSAVDDDSKGNEWKVDYHVVALCEEAASLLGDRA